MLHQLLSWPRKNCQLVAAMTAREIASRFRGSLAGLAWLLLTPLLVLAIYHFVFTEIFKARWATPASDDAPFALSLYTGLIVFTAFSEPVSRAPGLLAAHVNLVKRVVFPLEALPMVAACSGGVIACLQAAPIIAGLVIWKQSLPWTAILFPLMLLPVILLAFGVTAIISAFGAYLTDLSHLTGILLTAAMFLSPVFYPVEAVPEAVRWLYQLNPLTASIENARAVLLDGVPPPFLGYLRGLATGLLAVVIGAAVFVWLKPGFADVL